MTNRSLPRMILLALSITLFLGINAFAQTGTADNAAASASDDAIVNAIYDKIEVKYASHLDHLNVVANNGEVTLYGWATTKSIRKDIIKLAKKTSNVTKVVSKMTVGVGVGCGPTEQSCGGTCIPKTEKCNTRGGKVTPNKP